MNIQKPVSWYSEYYRRWVATLPCVVTLEHGVQVAHIRRGSGAGGGQKPSDFRTVPLKPSEHDLQHHVGELTYWFPYGGYENAVVLAEKIFSLKYNTPQATLAIQEWNRRWVKRAGAITMRHKFIEEKGE